MKKLIKLSDTHYVVVDDSQVLEGNYVIEDIGGTVYGPIDRESIVENPKKIIRSTEPLGDIKQISLSEVNEMLSIYNANKSLDILIEKDENLYSMLDGSSYKIGFNAHKELTKDKLFSIEDLEKAFKAGCMYSVTEGFALMVRDWNDVIVMSSAEPHGGVVSITSTKVNGLR